MAQQAKNRDRDQESQREGSDREFPRPSLQVAHAAEAEAETNPARELRPHERSARQRRIVEIPQEPQPEQDRQAVEESRLTRLRREHPFLFLFGLILLALAATSGYLYWNYAQHFESTDDAFIAARQFAIAPKVTGYIVAVPVTDNQHVNAGDVIARVDDRDYRIALDQAQAQVASARAGIENIEAQINVQQAQISASQAQLEQAKAALVFAQQQAARYQQLAQTGSGTVQNAQQYSSQLTQQQAAVTTAEANVRVAQRQLESLQAQRATAAANLEQAKAQRDQAQLNLSYTTVTAEQPGRVVNLTVAVGQFAQTGTNLTMFVPDQIWVTANFKETQLEYMRPNQTVAVEIDAYPHRDIHGHVASIQPGSGTAFALLPAQNATGNYVKVVQRVPVKILLDDPPPDVALGPGMSVVPSVRINPNPSVYERLKKWL
jgi:membrane fusion protein (multidrug efflux system)